MPRRLERREYRIARSKIQHGVLLGAVLAAIGLGVIAFAGPAIPDGELIGAICLALSLAVLGLTLRSARDRRPQLVLDERGVEYRDWNIGPVPWHHLAGAAIGGSRVRSHLAVRLADAERFAAGLPQPARRQLRSNGLIRLPELHIPQGALEAGLEEVCAAINEALTQARRGA